LGRFLAELSRWQRRKTSYQVVCVALLLPARGLHLEGCVLHASSGLRSKSFIWIQTLKLLRLRREEEGSLLEWLGVGSFIREDIGVAVLVGWVSVAQVLETALQVARLALDLLGGKRHVRCVILLQLAKLVLFIGLLRMLIDGLAQLERLTALNHLGVGRLLLVLWKEIGFESLAWLHHLLVVLSGLLVAICRIRRLGPLHHFDLGTHRIGQGIVCVSSDHSWV